jgi:hypothetical protein
MRFGIDIGIDAQAYRRFFSKVGRDFCDTIELGFGFDIERENPRSQGEANFPGRFPDTRKNDFPGSGAGGEREREFIERGFQGRARIDVAGGAEISGDVRKSDRFHMQLSVGKGKGDHRADSFSGSGFSRAAAGGEETGCVSFRDGGGRKSDPRFPHAQRKAVTRTTMARKGNRRDMVVYGRMVTYGNAG